MTRFAADAAHDLRAPLQAITGFAQLLARREGAALDETSQRFLAMIMRAAGDMAKLINAALEHGQADLDRRSARTRRLYEPSSSGRCSTSTPSSSARGRWSSSANSRPSTPSRTS